MQKKYTDNAGALHYLLRISNFHQFRHSCFYKTFPYKKISVFFQVFLKNNLSSLFKKEEIFADRVIPKYIAKCNCLYFAEKKKKLYFLLGLLMLDNLKMLLPATSRRELKGIYDRKENFWYHQASFFYCFRFERLCCYFSKLLILHVRISKFLPRNILRSLAA